MRKRINMVYENILAKIKSGEKLLAVLIDPDKYCFNSNIDLRQVDKYADIILVGGSLVFNGIDKLVSDIKAVSNKPVVHFPGGAHQLSPCVDALLFLSLLSGRNADFLVGNHVVAAPFIKQYHIEPVSVGYILIDGGKTTTVEYISNTRPIPSNKPDIAVATAMAGEMLGLKMIYLEAGSGAEKPVPMDLIKQVRKNISIPLIVGGGMRSVLAVKEALLAGADIVVVGTLFESQPEILKEIGDMVHSYN